MFLLLVSLFCCCCCFQLLLAGVDVVFINKNQGFFALLLIVAVILVMVINHRFRVYTNDAIYTYTRIPIHKIDNNKQYKCDIYAIDSTQTNVTNYSLVHTLTHTDVYCAQTFTRTYLCIHIHRTHRLHLGRKERTFKSTITLPLKSLRFYFWQLKLIGHQNVDPPSVLAHFVGGCAEGCVYLCRTYFMDFIQPLFNVIDELCNAYKSQHFVIIPGLKCFKR